MVLACARWGRERGMRSDRGGEKKGREREGEGEDRKGSKKIRGVREGGKG